MGSLIFFNSALAVTKTDGHLTITYPDEPLFEETNIAPGFATSKIITVTNNADEEKNIGVEFTGTISELDEVLNSSIQKNATTIYGGLSDPKTLNDLINAGEISLTTLGAGQSADFTLSLELGEDVSNDYQDKISVFDLSVGFIETTTPPPSNANANTNTPSNTNNTNGIVLGAETEQEPKIKGKFLGKEVELPLSGSQLLRYSLIIITLLAIITAVIAPIYHKPNSKRKKTK